MKKIIAAIVSVFGMGEVLAIIGAAGLCYGAHSVYEPAGFLTGGVLFLTAGVLIARPKPKR